jgi:CII-binding regulator of phage lambda lysogenization HflD
VLSYGLNTIHKLCFCLHPQGSSTVTEEVEKLQETNATLQRANLRLESENLELRLDLEKYRSDTPRLREQVQHLETLVSHYTHISGFVLVELAFVYHCTDSVSHLGLSTHGYTEQRGQ